MFFAEDYNIERAHRLVGSSQEDLIASTINSTQIPRCFEDAFTQGGITTDQQRALILRMLIYTAISGTLIFLGSLISGCAFLIFAILAEYLVLQRRIHRRAVEFERDYPTFLLSLASSVRTGLDTVQAIQSVKEMYPESSELRKELSILCESLNAGTSEEDAFLAFGSSIAHPDIRLFSAALILSRKQGSSLGACLQRLTKVTRQRQSFRRKSRAAVAMQRMSAFGIAGCSVLIGGMQIGMNPKNFIDSWHHPLGHTLIVSGILLLTIGLSWMLRLGRSRI